MKNSMFALFLMVFFINPVMAKKPEWAGKEKSTAEQKVAHIELMEAKDDLEEIEDKVKEEQKNKSDKLKGLEQQKIKKTQQLKKELDKGSEKGKKARETNRKKWWKFWEES